MPKNARMCDESRRGGAEQESEGTVSFEQTRRLYRVWRWRIEQPSSMRFVGTWSRVSSADMDQASRLALANVAWGLAALERTWAVLLEDATRAEAIKREGAPAIMHFLSGPYKDSLEYLVGASLWLDLGDVLVAYRTVVDRFRYLRGPARRGSLKPHFDRVTSNLDTLEQRRVPALSPDPLTLLANTVLHESWHPSTSRELAFELYWKGEGTMEVDFSEGPVMDQLGAQIEETANQLDDFFNAVLGGKS